MGSSKWRRLWLVVIVISVALGSPVMVTTSVFAATPYRVVVSLTVCNMPAGVSIREVSAHVDGPNGYSADRFFNSSGMIYLESLADSGVYKVTRVACATDPYDFESWSGGQVTLDGSSPNKTISVVVTWPVPATSTTVAPSTTSSTATSPSVTASPTTRASVGNPTTTENLTATTEKATITETSTGAPAVIGTSTTASIVGGSSESSSVDGGMSALVVVLVGLGAAIVVGAIAVASVRWSRRGGPAA